MIELKPTTREDLPQIQEWIAVDLWHRDCQNDPEWLLTGKGELTFHIRDDDGPLCFVRLDAENGMLRLATQFGPEKEVSKHRLVAGLMQCGIPAIIEFGKKKDFKGIVFESESESLIKFMNRQGFFKAAQGDDYALMFEEKI